MATPGSPVRTTYGAAGSGESDYGGGSGAGGIGASVGGMGDVGGADGGLPLGTRSSAAETFAVLVEGTELECCALAFKVRSANLRRDRFETTVSPLLRLLFFNKDPCRLFALTRTEDEASLIFDEGCDTRALEEAGAFLGSPTTHGAIEVHEGSSALSMTGLIAAISGGLADLDMPVIYVSTFNSDVLLVPVERLEDAVGCLKQRFGMPDAPSASPPPAMAASPLGPASAKSPVPVPAPPPPTPAAAAAGASGAPAPASGPVAPALTPAWIQAIREEAGSHGLGAYMDLSASLGTVQLANMPKSRRNDACFALLKVFFFTDADPRFCSYVETADDITMIVDGASLSCFAPDELKVHTASWRTLRVSKGAVPFSDAKLVSMLALTLAGARVPIYYVGCNNSDFVLVDADSFDTAVKCLRDQLNVDVDVEA